MATGSRYSESLEVCEPENDYDRACRKPDLGRLAHTKEGRGRNRATPARPSRRDRRGRLTPASGTCPKTKKPRRVFSVPQQQSWLAGVGEDANYEYSIPRPNATPESPKVRKRDRDRAEAIRLAGGPKPSLRDRAVALALERGTVRTRDLTKIGIPRCYLTRMCDEGLLEKVSYGVYRAAVRKAA